MLKIIAENLHKQAKVWRVLITFVSHPLPLVTTSWSIRILEIATSFFPTYLLYVFAQMGDRQSCPDSRIVETSCGKVQGRRLIYKEERQVEAFQVRFWDNILQTRWLNFREYPLPSRQLVNCDSRFGFPGTPTSKCVSETRTSREMGWHQGNEKVRTTRNRDALRQWVRRKPSGMIILWLCTKRFFKRGTPSEDCLYLNVFTPCWKAPQGGQYEWWL